MTRAHVLTGSTSTASPSTASPSTASPSTASPSTASPSTASLPTASTSRASLPTASPSTAPASTVLASTAPPSPALASTAPPSTAQASTALASTALASTALASTALLLSVFGAAPARAQWTLPMGGVAAATTFDFDYADSEFFGQPGEPSGERAFPLNGQYFGATATLSARGGLTDQLELEVSVPLRVVSYSSDPVLLIPQPEGSMESSLDFYQRNIIQLAQAQAGLGDVRVAGRYNFFRAPQLLLTAELALKVPGGYQGPAGTFGEAPTSTQDFLDNVGTFVAPENVRDDVTLGDAQVDLAGRLLAGIPFPTGTFLAGDIGYNARFDDAGHQFLASLRVGQLIEGVLLLFAGASFAYTVTEGRVIGVSVAAEDPSVPAEDYGGLTNLFLREVRLERDFLSVYGGAILRLSPDVELKISYARVAWGQNVAATNTLSFGIGARTSLLGAGP